MSKYFIICKCKICAMNVSEMVNKHILQNKVRFLCYLGSTMITDPHVNQPHGGHNKTN